MAFSKRQIEIIEASTKLIHLGGIQQLTTKNIALEMGFSEPAIYRHFKNKTHILQSIILHYRDQMKIQAQNLITSKRSVKELLGALMQVQFAHFSENPAIATVIFSESSFEHDKELSETIKQVVLSKKKLVCQLIEQGQAEGTIRKDIAVEMLAVNYLGALRFTMLEWRLGAYTFDLNERGLKLSQALNLWM